MVKLTDVQHTAVRTSALFCGIDDAAIDLALGSNGVQIVRFKTGDSIVCPGETQKRLGILLSGHAEVYKAANGSSVLMSVLNSGDMVGMAIMFLPNGSAVTKVTARGSVNMLFFDESTVKSMMQMNFSIVENYLSHLASRVHFLTDRLESIASPTVAERLLSYLKSAASNGRVTLPCGYTKLADSLSVSRASLYRVMGELCEAGIIKREGSQIILCDNEEDSL